MRKSLRIFPTFGVASFFTSYFTLRVQLITRGSRLQFLLLETAFQFSNTIKRIQNSENLASIVTLKGLLNANRWHRCYIDRFRPIFYNYYKTVLAQ